MDTLEKKKLVIFILIAYGITYLMGLLMWYGNKNGLDLSVFPNAQMLYPAAGVVLGYLVTNKGKQNLPKGFFVTILVTTGALILLSIFSVIYPVEPLNIQGASMSVYLVGAQYLLIIGSVVGWVFFAIAGKEKRDAVGLTRKNWKWSVLMVVLFVAIYTGRTLLSLIWSGVSTGVGMEYLVQWLGTFTQPMFWISLVALLINYFFVYIAFFGEEYGWRYYLQPIMQKNLAFEVA